MFGCWSLTLQLESSSFKTLILPEQRVNLHKSVCGAQEAEVASDEHAEAQKRAHRQEEARHNPIRLVLERQEQRGQQDHEVERLA